MPLSFPVRFKRHVPGRHRPRGVAYRMYHCCRFHPLFPPYLILLDAHRGRSPVSEVIGVQSYDVVMVMVVRLLMVNDNCDMVGSDHEDDCDYSSDVAGDGE